MASEEGEGRSLYCKPASSSVPPHHWPRPSGAEAPRAGVVAETGAAPVLLVRKKLDPDIQTAGASFHLSPGRPRGVQHDDDHRGVVSPQLTDSPPLHGQVNQLLTGGREGVGVGIILSESVVREVDAYLGFCQVQLLPAPSNMCRSLFFSAWWRSSRSNTTSGTSTSSGSPRPV